MVDTTKSYSLDEAVEILKKCPPAKFDQSVDVSLHMGVDPRRTDQLTRGTVSLPNGTGKKLIVLVFCQGDKVDDAMKAGADFAGNDELLQKVNSGWTGFDAVIATPDMMREVGKLGKILGPRGLMPTPKAGTVTNDVAKAVQEVKGGKIEFKPDRHGIMNNIVGKISFAPEKIVENLMAFLHAVIKAKPATAKGQYILSMTLSTTMGPGMKIDMRRVDIA